MTFIRASLLMLAASLALLLAAGVKAAREYPELQGTKDASTMKAYGQTRTEEIHGRLFKVALEAFQAHTHTFPDEEVKAKIAKALKAYHARAHPQEGGNNVKVEFASLTPKRSRPFSTTTGAALPESNPGATTHKKAGVDCDDEGGDDGEDEDYGDDKANEPAGEGEELDPTQENASNSNPIPTNHPDTPAGSPTGKNSCSCADHTLGTSMTTAGFSLCFCLHGNVGPYPGFGGLGPVIPAHK